MFNMFDLASYLPQLGRLTSSLGQPFTEDMQKKRKKTKKKCQKKNNKESVILVKQPLLPPPAALYSAYGNRMLSRTAVTKTRKMSNSAARAKPKRARILKKTENKAVENALPLRQPANNANESTKEAQGIEDAIEDFTSKKDQFVRSLECLQKKLIRFQIPDVLQMKLLSNAMYTQSPPNIGMKRNKENEKNKPTKRRKDIRSVSQHFYLADMTESDKSSTSSSTTESSDEQQSENESSEVTFSRNKVQKYLENDLVPVNPPEKKLATCRKPNRTSKTPVLRMKSRTGPGTLDVHLNQLRKNLAEISRKPVKADFTKQKSVNTLSKACDPGLIKRDLPNRRASPRAEQAVAKEFKKLKKESEAKLREKLKKTINAKAAYAQ